MTQGNSMIKELSLWASSLGTSLHPDVQIYEDPTTGMSFRALNDLAPETRLVSCSYRVTLSYLNAVDASNFPQNTNMPFPGQFLCVLGLEDPNIIGHFFLMQQYLLGEKSHWWSYIRLLPQPDQPSIIPALWSEEDQRYLDGTNAEPAIKKRTDLWNKEWTKGVELLQNRFDNWEKYTLLLYKWAASIFGSRSFRPSLVIPEALVPDHKEHVAKDKFSVLLPVIDIGNHNGINNISWTPDSVTGVFTLSNRGLVHQNDQVFNYYGKKSNSELLVGYGFTLPTTPDLDMDVVNLKLKPELDAMELRRSQRCHTIAREPEAEFMFAVQKRIARESRRLDDFTPFSDGLMDLLICMVANKRERKYLLRNSGYCPEDDPAIFETTLARATCRALDILLAKLASETEKISAILARHQNSNQRIALDYGKRQLSVLSTAKGRIAHKLSAILTPRIFYPSEVGPGLDSDQLHVTILSLHGAFEWLRINYPDVHDPVVEMISQDQEESLPLNWAVLVEDWDHTYWVVWVFIIWMLWAREGEAFQARFSFLSSWMLDMNSAYDDEINLNGSVLYADASESPTIDLMINGITKLPQFATVYEWLQSDGSVNETTIRNFASFVAHEENILTNQELWDSDSRENITGSGSVSDQKVLFITKRAEAQSPEEKVRSWTAFLSQSPGFRQSSIVQIQ